MMFNQFWVWMLHIKAFSLAYTLGKCSYKPQAIQQNPDNPMDYFLHLSFNQLTLIAVIEHPQWDEPWAMYVY